MLHSIIIPHKDRLPRLRLCIWSIERSAKACGIDDYEIVISNQGSSANGFMCCAHLDNVVSDFTRVQVINDNDGPPEVDTPDGPVRVFNKPRALNRGIEAARGGVLTFLDCDTICSRFFMSGVGSLTICPTITRLCYRVRYLPEKFAELTPGLATAVKIEQAFNRYGDYPRAHEGIFSPEVNRDCHEQEVPPYNEFGNSHFSIRRDVLGDTRCDEAFVSAGWEDLDLIMSIAKTAGEDYTALLRTSPSEALFNIRNHREDDWHNEYLNTKNRERYYEKWPTNPST